MKTLKELSDSWRREYAGCGAAERDVLYCADQLDKWAAENMPEMVEITETSYPLDGQDVLMYVGRKIYNAVGIGMYLPSLRGYWFRPLGPSDRPPQEKN